MKEELVLAGDPKLLAGFEQALREEFASRGVQDQVTVHSQLVPVPVAPGEMGFGEEIRQVLVGLAGVLRAGDKAITEVAGGIARRLSQGSMTFRTQPDGTVELRARSGGEGELTAMTAELAGILRAQQASPPGPATP